MGFSTKVLSVKVTEYTNFVLFNFIISCATICEPLKSAVRSLIDESWDDSISGRLSSKATNEKTVGKLEDSIRVLRNGAASAAQLNLPIRLSTCAMQIFLLVVCAFFVWTNSARNLTTNIYSKAFLIVCLLVEFVAEIMCRFGPFPS